ncbi:hypothetical protein evm_008781 [Chilo suppressalis]|nr:hypothetical protein evm_008781 [Chilo suppressalis]
MSLFERERVGKENYPRMHTDIQGFARFMEHEKTNYRKECKKIKTKKCSDLDSTYKSTLWYFNALTFLNGQKDTFDVNISKFNETEAVESDSEYRITSKVKDSDDESRNGSRLSILVDYENSTADNSEVNTPKENAVIEENILHYPNEDLSEKKDEYYYWAISCASDLRKMESVQQIYAKKAIAEILMEGQLGLLHRNSMKLNNS